MTTNNSQPPIRLQHDDSPRSGAQTPNELVDTPIDQEALVTVDEMRKKTKSTINEYLSIKDINVSYLCYRTYSFHLIFFLPSYVFYTFFILYIFFFDGV